MSNDFDDLMAAAAKSLGINVNMGDMHACELCHVVNDKVEQHYADDLPNTRARWLCRKCQKTSFHFFASMLVLGHTMDKEKTTVEKAQEMQRRMLALAKKNSITADYARKLLLHTIQKMTNKT
jgi:hypothetical protein